MRTLHDRLYQRMQEILSSAHSKGIAQEAIVKLGSNENPYGPSPRVAEALASISPLLGLLVGVVGCHLAGHGRCLMLVRLALGLQGLVVRGVANGFLGLACEFLGLRTHQERADVLTAGWRSCAQAGVGGLRLDRAS